MNALKRTIWTKFLIVAVLTLGVQVAARGSTIQDIIDSGGSVTIGDFTFSDFAVQGTSAGGNAPMAHLIDIDFGETDGDGVVLNFHGAWSAGPLPSALTTSNISYKITMAEGYTLESSDLSIVSSLLLGDGYMLMNEALYDGDPAEPDSVILAEHLLQEGLGEDIRGDSVTFDPVGELYVNTALFLQTTEAGSIVQITQFSQTFGGVQVVPEPSTLFIIAIGAAAMILKRCRRRN